jgi:hypothetical protein
MGDAPDFRSDTFPMPNEHDKFAAAISSLEEFCKKLKTEIDSARPETNDEPASVSAAPAYFFQREGMGTIMLSERDFNEFYDCVLRLHEVVPQGRDVMTLRAVEFAAHEAMLKSFFPKQDQPEVPFIERLSAAFVELRDVLRRASNVLWIHLQVAGLIPTELPRKVGSVEFYAKTYPASQFPQPNGPLQGMVTVPYARIPAKAKDSDAAIEMAIRELRQTFDLLNYFGGVVGNREARAYLPWEATAFNLNAGVSNTDGFHTSLTHHEWRGPWIPFSLDLLFTTPRAKRGGFPRALEILSKTNRSSLEDRLLTAIQWAGRATVEERREEALLLFTVALESLVVNADEKDQITQRFAIRGAHLIGKDFVSRKLIYKRLKELYRCRSAIVHSGSIKIADADRDTIAHFVRVAIFTMLVVKPFCDMTTVEEFHTWFEDETLGRHQSTPASSEESEKQSPSDSSQQ